MEECAKTLAILIKLLRKLGFHIHWGKVVDPTNKITFLGIELDSISMSIRLTREKQNLLIDQVNGFLRLKRAPVASWASILDSKRC